jgi:hypothetical protein
VGNPLECVYQFALDADVCTLQSKGIFPSTSWLFNKNGKEAHLPLATDVMAQILFLL